MLHYSSYLSQNNIVQWKFNKMCEARMIDVMSIITINKGTVFALKEDKMLSITNAILTFKLVKYVPIQLL